MGKLVSRLCTELMIHWKDQADLAEHVGLLFDVISHLATREVDCFVNASLRAK